MNRGLGYWTCQVLGWGAYAGFGLATSAASVRLTPEIIAAFAAAGTGAVLMSHLYRRGIRRRDWMRLGFAAQIPRLLGGSLVWGTAAGVIALVAARAISGFRPGPVGASMIVLSWVMGMVYWSAIYAAVHGIEAYGRSQLAAKEAQLRALRAQVNPHFLFNSLNSIRGLIAEDPAKAQEMVTQFAHLLRYSLDADKHELVPLSTEIDVVRSYLACEKIRFEDQLKVEWSLGENAMKQSVPPMIVQTLVENGVKHGQSQNGALLRVTADCDDRFLYIEVWNRGRLAPPAGHHGLGIESSRQRIELLHGPSAELQLRTEAGGYVVARLRLPRSAS